MLNNVLNKIHNILKLNYSQHFKFKFHTTFNFQFYSNVLHLNNYYLLDFSNMVKKIKMLPIISLIDCSIVL